MFLSLLMIFFSFLMFFLNHPLSMGFMILIQSILTCLLSGMIIETYWFSYILFLTFLGGLLVLFIYVSSIASNEIFKFNNNMKMYFLLTFLMCLNMSIINYKNISWLNMFNNFEIFNFNFLLFFNNENMLNLTKLYNNQTFMMMIMLIIYLFITLVVVVKITNIFYGPLRSNF
uniref:NADH-ubiquinone oxidoreductase chain 6 n=1 Tax=Monema flavescens TaxID=1078814 RepID=A0A1L2JGS1_MONFL|nr:NADH dehydrogenase subunit 6 [Monema flavescens]AOV94110.1 NADH dehydrogenase subunit 6 [Monema flavescens]ATO90164.1 NADH dehydrogenase subunit 6 [Monema flavescens]